MKGRAVRLATKPIASAARIGSRPIARATSVAVARARSEVRSPATTSTSRIAAGGLKKCMPQTRSGRSHPGGDRGHRQRGGVGGQDRLGPADGGQPAEQLALQLQVLGGRLDHQLAPRQALELRGGAEASRRGLGLRLRPAAAVGSLDQRVAKPLLAGVEGIGAPGRAGRSRIAPGSASCAIPAPIVPAPTTPTRSITPGVAEAARPRSNRRRPRPATCARPRRGCRGRRRP